MKRQNTEQSFRGRKDRGKRGKNDGVESQKTSLRNNTVFLFIDDRKRLKIKVADLI